MVGISLLTLIPGISGGSETYARNLCRALARVGGLEYRVFVPEIAADAADGLPWQVVGSYRSSRSMPGRIAAMSRAALLPKPLLRELGVERLTAIHFPLSVMLPAVERPPAATTVLDLQHEEHPQFFGRAELAYRRSVYGRTIRRSRIVITISEHARRTLIERYDLDPERVRAIHLAVDHDVFTPEISSRGAAPVGAPAAGSYQRALHQLVEALDLEGVVRFTGSVAPGVLAAHYRSADVFVCLSEHEGFCVPLVEAMRHRVPVVAFAAAAVPETVGAAALLLRSKAPLTVAAAVERLRSRPDLLEALVAGGLCRASEFDVARSTARFAEVLGQALGAA